MTDDWYCNSSIPGCLIFLVEQSDEVSKAGASGFSLSFEMKRMVDYGIGELIERLRKGDEIYPRVKVGIFGYSNSHFSWCSSIKQELSGLNMISDFGECDKEYEDEQLEIHLPDLFKENLRGNGDIANGISNLIEVVQRFAVEHPESPPPIVYHLFHTKVQHAQKKNVLSAMENLKSVATNRGNALLFNIRMNSQQKEPQVFPHKFSNLNDIYDVISMEGSSYLPLSLQKEYAWRHFGGNFYDYNVERKCYISASGFLNSIERLTSIFRFQSSMLPDDEQIASAERGFYF